MRFSHKALLAAMVALLSASPALAVRGKTLLLDAPDRTAPGDLVLGTINGDDLTYEVLAKGKVVDAGFSPDGKQVVFGVDATVKIMDLATRKVRDLCTYDGELTYFNWTSDGRILWSEDRTIFAADLKTGEKMEVHKGNKGRSTISQDGKRAAWVMPPVAAEVGGKQYRYQGGCGGAVSPSGKYLTSNLTTTHRLIGIFEFRDDGPTAKPVKTIPGPEHYAVNGFFFGRSDDWVLFVLEHPKQVVPTSYICHLRTGEHIRVSEMGKYCIRDFYDQSDEVPAGAKLEKITVCGPGPSNTPLESEYVHVAGPRDLKVVGHYTLDGQTYTPQLREGVTWKADASKVKLTPSSIEGVALGGPITVTAEFKGHTDSFDATVLPALTGDGFKAEYFQSMTAGEPVVTRVEPHVNLRFAGRGAPDGINGRKPWSVRWTGTLDVQIAGEYRFGFVQGEGNDKVFKTESGQPVNGWEVRIDGEKVIARDMYKGWNYPWDKPRVSEPVKLDKGRHAVTVTAVDASSHPAVAELYWSGPGVDGMALLGDGWVNSGLTAEQKAKLNSNDKSDGE